MRSMGRVRVHTAHDLFNDAVDVLEDILIREAQNMPTLPAQKRIAPAIMRKFLDSPMCRAVNLDDKSTPDMGKVCNIGSDRMLPPKFETVHICFAKSGPDDNFCLGHALSKSPRT